VENTAVGDQALASNIGQANTATGFQSLFSNTDGFENTATGVQALFSNTIGHDNTAYGDQALLSNTIGNQNTANGTSALASNATGVSNTASGYQALFSNVSGSGNTANGTGSLSSNTISNGNTAVGFRSLFSSTGGDNTAIGDDALLGNTTGNLNVALGASAGLAVSTANNVICIGTLVQGENVSNSCYIGNVFDQTSAGGTAVFINSNGKLGTTTSSQRFKEEVQSMADFSEALFSLKPVTFRYKKEIDPTGTRQLALVAEEVEKVNPDLVVRDKDGRPYSVRYDQVNAMLLNEFSRSIEKWNS
jgi:hypothetical protein